MEDLPTEILDMVSCWLSKFEPDRNSMWAFAATSKTCYAASERQRYSRIRVEVESDTQLNRDLARLDQAFDTSTKRGCVRRLTVGPRMATYDDNPDTFAELQRGYSAELFAKSSAEVKISRHTWQLFALLISKLPLIHDLVWTAPVRIHAYILHVLHGRKPLCRLHVHTFCPHIILGHEIRTTIESSDCLLATSPCLYSVVGPYTSPDFRGRVLNCAIAIQQMVAWSTPNLKHVHVWPRPSEVSSGLGPWLLRNTLVQPHTDEPPKGQLETLTIEPNGAMSTEALVRWREFTDFSFLRTLKFTNRITAGAMEMLADFTESGVLKHLEALQLPTRRHRTRHGGRCNQALHRLLSSSQALRYLSVKGMDAASFDVLLEKHAASIQHLDVEEYFLDYKQIARISQSCTNLRHFRLEIVRTRGNDGEVASYRALGRIQKLETLTVTLHCEASDDVEISEDQEEEDMKLAFEEIFINAAVDRDLALAIVGEMHGQANPPSRLSRILLEVAPISLIYKRVYLPSGFRAIHRWIGRYWEFDYDPRDTHRGQFRVTEKGEAYRIRFGNTLQDDLDDFLYSEDCAAVWEQLWPGTRNNWKDGWSSHPLAENFVE
ncbi:unnamed protein product [Periconia digitata]|uniref:Uncharacterized protein n=1 Tax=Periconia digitata TaxID=1303443 RepID=A0A9W4XRC9_9PLEO|nr:unnamed protein product [Periconia digitata]